MKFGSITCDLHTSVLSNFDQVWWALSTTRTEWVHQHCYWYSSVVWWMTLWCSRDVKLSWSKLVAASQLHSLATAALGTCFVDNLSFDVNNRILLHQLNDINITLRFCLLRIKINSMQFTYCKDLNLKKIALAFVNDGCQYCTDLNGLIVDIMTNYDGRLWFFKSCAKFTARIDHNHMHKCYITITHDIATSTFIRPTSEPQSTQVDSPHIHRV